ncbi:unnamed protein product [Notodromas monacha]|uniref:C-type lectin domain-containing protein n=1 Tax=Notodromas monacha TaxID=399045 RepID=A0A7R9BUV3_9CRUS|nr:unnamed protein product [Notodromas monacha]CAG0922162.1 unnamed protein product [Notodromas monacha]
MRWTFYAEIASFLLVTIVSGAIIPDSSLRNPTASLRTINDQPSDGISSIINNSSTTTASSVDPINTVVVRTEISSSSTKNSIRNETNLIFENPIRLKEGHGDDSSSREKTAKFANSNADSNILPEAGNGTRTDAGIQRTIDTVRPSVTSLDDFKETLGTSVSMRKASSDETGSSAGISQQFKQIPQQKNSSLLENHFSATKTELVPSTSSLGSSNLTDFVTKDSNANEKNVSGVSAERVHESSELKNSWVKSESIFPQNQTKEDHKSMASNVSKLASSETGNGSTNEPKISERVVHGTTESSNSSFKTSPSLPRNKTEKVEKFSPNPDFKTENSSKSQITISGSVERVHEISDISESFLKTDQFFAETQTKNTSSYVSPSRKQEIMANESRSEIEFPNSSDGFHAPSTLPNASLKSDLANQTQMIGDSSQNASKFPAAPASKIATKTQMFPDSPAERVPQASNTSEPFKKIEETSVRNETEKTANSSSASEFQRLAAENTSRTETKTPSASENVHQTSGNNGSLLKIDEISQQNLTKMMFLPEHQRIPEIRVSGHESIAPISSVAPIQNALENISDGSRNIHEAATEKIASSKMDKIPPQNQTDEVRERISEISPHEFVPSSNITTSPASTNASTSELKFSSISESVREASDANRLKTDQVPLQNLELPEQERLPEIRVSGQETSASNFPDLPTKNVLEIKPTFPSDTLSSSLQTADQIPQQNHPLEKFELPKQRNPEIRTSVPETGASNFPSTRSESQSSSPLNIPPNEPKLPISSVRVTPAVAANNEHFPKINQQIGNLVEERTPETNQQEVMNETSQCCGNRAGISLPISTATIRNRDSSSGPWVSNNRAVAPVVNSPRVTNASSDQGMHLSSLAEVRISSLQQPIFTSSSVTEQPLSGHQEFLAPTVTRRLSPITTTTTTIATPTDFGHSPALRQGPGSTVLKPGGEIAPKISNLINVLKGSIREGTVTSPTRVFDFPLTNQPEGFPGFQTRVGDSSPPAAALGSTCQTSSTTRLGDIDAFDADNDYMFSWTRTAQKFTWTEARDFCRANCMYPVSVEDSFKAAFLKERLEHHSPCSINIPTSKPPPHMTKIHPNTFNPLHNGKPRNKLQIDAKIKENTVQPHESAAVGGRLDSIWTSGRRCDVNLCAKSGESPFLFDGLWTWTDSGALLQMNDELGFSDWIRSAAASDSGDADCLALTSPSLRSDSFSSWQWMPRSCNNVLQPVVCQRRRRPLLAGVDESAKTLARVMLEKFLVTAKPYIGYPAFT